MKPGVKTTEFWITVLLVLVMTAVSICLVFQENVKTKLLAIVPAVLTFLKVHWYDLNRLRLKMQEMLRGCPPPPPPVLPPLVPPPAPPCPMNTTVTLQEGKIKATVKFSTGGDS